VIDCRLPLQARHFKFEALSGCRLVSIVRIAKKQSAFRITQAPDFLQDVRSASQFAQRVLDSVV
jgi:hypothetical protein